VLGKPQAPSRWVRDWPNLKNRPRPESLTPAPRPNRRLFARSANVTHGLEYTFVDRSERYGVPLLGRIEAGRTDRKIVLSAGGRWEASCPRVESLSSRNERLSRATFLSIPLSSPLSILLDKIRNMDYVLLLTESLPARRLPGPGEEKPRLFENLPDHNPRRELKGGRGFPYLNRP
jgi:hypothetical protein